LPILLLIPPLLFLGAYFQLHASGPLALIIPIEIPLILGFFEKRRGAEFSVLIRYVRIGLYLLLFLSFLIFILLIPDTLYNAWLRLLHAGRPGGVISFAFVYILGIVSSFGSMTLVMGKSRGNAFLELLLMINMILIILFPEPAAFLPFLFLTGFQFYMLQAKPGRNLKSVLTHLLLLGTSLIFAFAIPLERDEAGGNPIVDKLSGVLQKSMAVLVPDLPLILNVPGYGTSFETTRKTGEKPLLSSRVVFTVEGRPSSILYLKTDVFYSRAGQWWIPERNREAEDAAAAAGQVTQSLEKYTLTFLSDLYTRIPLSGSTELIEYRNQIYPVQESLALSPPGEIPIVRGDTLILYNNSGIILSAEQLETEKTRALNIAEDMKELLLPLARRLEGADSMSTLNNIRDYLNENFIYTLETESSENMVADFLFNTHEGYCVHFSTAAALLARTLEIPVRMAEGFILQIPQSEEGLEYPVFQETSTAYVTGYSAHQWPEILSGGRWIPWEVTPPYTSLSENTDFTGLPGGERGPGNRSEPAGSGKEGLERERRLSLVRSFPYIIIFVSVCASALILFRLLYPLGSGVSDRQLRRALYKLGAKGLKRHRLPLPEQSGWLGWFEQYLNRKPESSAAVIRIRDLILRFLYSGAILEDDERVILMKGLRGIMKTLGEGRKYTPL